MQPRHACGVFTMAILLHWIAGLIPLLCDGLARRQQPQAGELPSEFATFGECGTSCQTPASGPLLESAKRCASAGPRGPAEIVPHRLRNAGSRLVLSDLMR